MEKFINDYQEGCLPQILEKLAKNNFCAFSGYGTDEICERARELVKKAVNSPLADVHFIAGGTLTNKIVITEFLKSYEGVICADTAHIASHETGAIESGGHKCLTLANKDGKITPEGVESLVKEHIDGLSREHTVKPAMVYISQSTEMGTVYTYSELKALSEVCKKYDLIFYIDGARILYSLFAKNCDFTLGDVSALCDVFYVGGTKAGALLGEALVINRQDLKKNFRYALKQNGALAAKGFLLGTQFEGLFENDNYVNYCKRAVDGADKIRQALKAKGVEFESDCKDTQTFAIFNESDYKTLEKEFDFGGAVYKNGKAYARICTSWATSQEKIDLLVKAIENL